MFKELFTVEREPLEIKISRPSTGFINALSHPSQARQIALHNALKVTVFQIFNYCI